MSDYIIIGAGSAGCILANRLSTDPSAHVTLIEAGGSGRHFFYHMPVGAMALMKTGMGNWRYESVPQPGLNGRTMYFPRGKVLGGSSAINMMVYVRGHAGDFDAWAQAGNRDWSYKDCLPYFRKLERFEKTDRYRASDGMIGISRPSRGALSPIGQTWLKAAEQAGHPFNEDYNGADQEGFALINNNIADAKRQSTSATYLAAARGRPNLTIISDASVTAIRIENGRATGVDYTRRGSKHVLETDGEVILAGGAINSPQLLQVSGIGPADLLRTHAIPVKHDLPGVGENFHDHIAVMVKQEITKPYSVLAYTKPLKAAMGIAQYLAFKSGPATSNGLELIAFLKSRPELAYPDIQYLLPMLLYNDHGREIIPREGFAAYVNGSQPRSRGRVAIASADPAQAPLIDPSFLADPEDLRVTRDAVRQARAIIAQEAFDDFRGPEYAPGSNKQTDAELDHFIRATAMSVYHPVGSCKMGHDPMAVVDDRLRVHGIERLRIVDASIMPTIVSGNTNAATMMIAEKAADFIKNG